MTENPAAETAPNTDLHEPCPTPLVWQEVVRSFQAEIRQGPVKFSGGIVTATQFGTGLPLVFLPGTLGSPKLFALTAWLLKDQRQCWLLDHPEFSQPPKPQNLINKTAEVYLTVLKDLFGGPVDLYAPTFGAAACEQMILKSPHALNRIALQSAWATRSLTFAEKALLNVGKHLSLPLRRLPLWLSTQIQNHRPWFPPYDDTRFGFLLNEMRNTPCRDVSRRLLAAAQFDPLGQFKDTRANVLMIRCEGDGELIAQQQDLLEAELLAAEQVKLDVAELHTSGHYPFLTHPHRLVKVLREFFEIPKPVTI